MFTLTVGRRYHCRYSGPCYKAGRKVRLQGRSSCSKVRRELLCKGTNKVQIESNLQIRSLLIFKTKNSVFEPLHFPLESNQVFSSLK